MREYYGESAAHYGMTKGKRLLLFPAIINSIPQASAKESKILDIACGNGDFFNLTQQKGYQYYGLDISEDMLRQAKIKHPTGFYKIADATDFARLYTEKFDVVLISMLFPSLCDKKSILKVLENSKKVLSVTGSIVIAVTHPCFDHYMQKFLFERDDVETDFKNYFDSGSKFKMNQFIAKKEFTFEDYHWTLTDYVNTIIKSGLCITSINECYNAPEGDAAIWSEKRNKFPTYMVITASKAASIE